MLIYANYRENDAADLIFFSPKEAQLLFRQLQKLSARNIAALKCERRKTKCWVPWYPPRAVKGCGMGTWLVLVSPCFRENVVATCNIGSFLCSLDNLLQRNVIVLFFGNQISKWHSFEKRAIFDLLFTFLVTREKLQNSFSTYLTHIHTCILLTLLTFLPYQF